MRGYQEGDDLRRIHWPSVARTGALMIRQDESSKRANGLVFIDTRAQALGQCAQPGLRAGGLGGRHARGHDGSARLLPAPGHRRSAGRRRHRGPVPRRAGGHLARAGPVDRAGPVTPARGRLGRDHARVRLLAAGSRRAHHVDPQRRRVRSEAGRPDLSRRPSSLPPERRTQLEGRATQAVLALTRAGWDVIVLPPSMRLKERWHVPRERPLARIV